MNKKRLSVVMAGAMLATSVAPVLAETEAAKATEVSANELGLLQEEVRRLVESKRFADDALNAPNGKANVKNQSVYEVYFNEEKQAMLTADAATSVWQARFNSLKVGDTVRVFDRGHKEVDGKYYHYETKVDVPRYTEDDLKESTGLMKILNDSGLVGTKANKKVIEETHYDTNLKGLVIKYNDDVKVPGIESSKSVLIPVGAQKIKVSNGHVVYKHTDGNEYESVNGNVPWPEVFAGFALDGTTGTVVTEIAGKLEKEYKIVPGGYNFDVSDLYDGLFLTDKGQEFFGLLKDSVAAGRTARIVINDDGVNHYAIGQNLTEQQIKQIEKDIYTNVKKYNEVYRFEVEITPAQNNDEFKKSTYTISGKDRQEVARLASWMLRPQARVDKFEGSNRYETAALIAREYAGLTRDSLNSKASGKYNEVTGGVNIVLVNGEALVDGLAAAPLAAKKANTVNGKSTSAPVLLTRADSLPRETKAYLREVLSNIALGDVPNVTINLVGGESVLSRNLEKELKAIGFHGFKVERFGGANREETSLEVAKEVGTNKAFVVGGEGEADAMSIAAVAAQQKTPIIVAKKGGISEDGIYEVRDRHVTIVGGKSVVTESEEKEIRTEAASVNRVKGANRKATNAAVIEKYYKTTAVTNPNGEIGFADAVGSAQNVIVAKDGQRNKLELVDALAAANMASEKKAPIVLATKALSKEQEAVINSHAKDAYGLFQVGGQVERPVVKKIAIMLNLTNRGTK